MTHLHHLHAPAGLDMDAIAARRRELAVRRTETLATLADTVADLEVARCRAVLEALDLATRLLDDAERMALDHYADRVPPGAA